MVEKYYLCCIFIDVSFLSPLLIFKKKYIWISLKTKKRKMKQISIIVGVLMACQLYAADLIVQQSGPSGTYNSISSAVTAAANGDRILINNRTDGLPWIEDVLINKSLTLLSAVDNQKFYVNGQYSIERAAGRAVTIVGMDNIGTNKNIGVTSATPLSVRTKINILASSFAGDVFSFNYNNGGVDLYFAQNTLENGSLNITYGKIIGNKIRKVALNSDPIISSDTIFIIGNLVGNATYGYAALGSSNTSQVLYISNNFFQCNASGSSSSWSDDNPVLDFNGTQKTGSILVNNSINNHGNGYSASVTGFKGVILNNAMNKLLYSHDQSMCYYNIAPTVTLPASQNNINLTPFFNTDGSISSSGWQNSGNPSNFYLDLDLTRNDIGCYGGSYSLSNFHPINDGKSSKVSFVTTPRVIYQGQTFTPSIIGLDK